MKYLIALILISGCKIKNGYIIEKKFVPAHDYNYVTYQQCGKTLIPITHHGYTDDEYIFVIQQKDEKNEISIDECSYQKWNVGQWYDKKIKK
jgi:hypothetical protein